MQHRRPRRGDDGAAAVEFALISFPLILLLFGIMVYGFYFFQATAVAGAAREGARAAAVGVDSCEDWEDLVRENAGGAAGAITSISLDGGATRGENMTVTIEWTPSVDIGLIPLPPSAPAQAITRAELLGEVTTGCAA